MGGDEQFEELYAYYPAIVSYLIGLGLGRDDARDLAQDVFVRVYRKMDTYRGEARWAYLQQVARRLAMNDARARHTAKREGQSVSADALVSLASGEPQADAVIEVNESVAELHAAIGQLDADSRRIVLLQLADHSYTEMSEILGISVAAVKSRLYVARARLRELLGDEADGLGGE